MTVFHINRNEDVVKYILHKVYKLYCVFTLYAVLQSEDFFVAICLPHYKVKNTIVFILSSHLLDSLTLI